MLEFLWCKICSDIDDSDIDIGAVAESQANWNTFLFSYAHFVRCKINNFEKCVLRYIVKSEQCACLSIREM